ncbi:tail assembly protein [Streptococcus phage Javan554]|uniref:phage tail spike protein n=1 Tax=Streptococcus suis TaxID=1307 RepID=UPI00041498A7|nr:phage tail spike protein [Streptococcus suis]QBX30535.1 tail assembly protein [Streptococcus phage Javan554]HEM3169537.1 phage tail protein [Streptococcus suis 89-3576-3]
MLLTIHDASLRKVAFIDNDKQATLNYFNDTWIRYLETGSSTFDFTVFKKAIISDVGRKRAYNYLNEKAFVSFQYKGKTYLHTIRKIEENEQVIKCYGINLNLELINEYANPYKAPKAMTFKEYCDAMDLLNFTFLKIGVNEISTQKISAEWEGTDTKLNRLLSLAKKFGAEIEFDTHLNADSSIKSFIVNVYHENDDDHQGVGRVSPTILKYGKNLKALTRTVDKTNVYNMVRPTGRTEDGKTVTISGLSAWSVNNSKGEREFYQAGEGLYAPLSMQMYPAAFTSGTTGDQWIRKDMTVESSNPEVIRSTAYRELKKNCYPAVTYEAEGFADLEIGDTVQVYDDGFSPVLLLEMRVSEQTISFTNPKNNKTTFSNAKALENRLSNGIQERLNQMIEASKPYLIKLATDNGVIFKNGTGQSIVTPTLYKGGKPLTANVTWRWSLDGAVKTGMTYSVRGADVTDTSTLTVAAYIGNDEVAVDELTFVNVLDGRDGGVGPKGDPGNDGVAGRDGQTPVVHWAYSDNADGTGLITSDNGQRYIGHYSDYTQADSTDKTKYRWADRWAKIEVGGRNLFKGSRDFSGVWFNNGNGVFFEEYKGVHIHRTKTAWLGKSQSIYVKSGEIYTFSFYAKSDSENDAVMFYLSHSATGTPAQGHPNNKNIGISTDYQRYSITIKIASDGIIVPRLERTNTTSFLFFGGFKLETGTLATDWSPAPEDLQNQLNSKADQALTQEQLNSLNERAGIIRAELEAKASLDTVNNILKQIKDMKAADEATWAKVEKDLITHLQRVIKIETNLGDQAQRWNAVDTFMQVSNDGLSLGKADGSSSILFSPDGRITMFSSGTPVMYVDKGVIHIDNGIFSKTVQIGRFREEQYHNNPDINVKRYVGG